MNFKFSLLLASSLLLLPGLSAAAQITPVSVTATGSVNHAPALIIDGVFPAESSAWTGASNVFWNGTDPVFTIDFGAIYNIDDVLLSVDNNDSYAVEWSSDAANWNSLFNIAIGDGEVGFGMDTMSTDSGNVEYIAGLDFFTVQAQYLRIFATGGDNKYSIGEVQAFGGSVSAVPVPAAAWLFGTGLLGIVGVARRKA